MNRVFGFRNKLVVAVIFGITLAVGIGIFPQKAHAEYRDENLIEDSLFLDAASMSQQQIQDFLTARGGYLAGYYSWSGRDNANVSAAQVIYEAAQDYGISPKAILATLQKEQSLVTAKNPASSQLNFAMGYGCPDSTGCGAKYSGFYNQVDNGVWQLRYNLERARGNNTWWRASSSYACGGATRYYSNGLYLNNTVTFYDDAGTGYKTIKIGSAATASLYCYTPHVYPGSSAQYYSGSYNFVAAYEQWFGSTHAATMITTGLQISQDQYGTTNTNVPVRVSFTITNNTSNTVDLGQMAVAGYDAAGNNVGYPLERIVMPPYTTYIYSEAQTFSREDTYTFWITSVSSGGVWSDSYPTSAGISVTRNIQKFIQAMPQIISQPTVSTDPRTGKTNTTSFTVRNRSARPAEMGKLALAIYGPRGENVGGPLQSVSIPAGQDYTYTASSDQWPATGMYTAWVTNTKDNGATWDDSFFPQPASSSVNRKVNFDVKSNPTVTATPSVSTSSPRAGQQVTTSFTLHNFSATPVSTSGKVALAIYDPNGRNIGGPLRDFSVPANGDMVYSFPSTFYTPGKYRMWITYFNGATFNDSTYPELESGAIQRYVEFTVKPSPTITVQPGVSVASPRAGQQVNASFTMHNYGDTTMNVGRIGMAIYGPNGENVGLAMQNMNIQPGADQVYSLPTTFYNPGKYTAWITYFDGRVYNDSTFPETESSSISRSFEFTVKPSPTITVQPNFSPSPRVGQQVAGGFTLHNYGTENVNSGKIGLAIYGPNGENVGLAMDPMVITAGGDMVYSKNTTFTRPGTYTAWVTYYNGSSYNDTSWPEADSGSVQRKITFTVAP